VVDPFRIAEAKRAAVEQAGRARGRASRAAAERVLASCFAEQQAFILDDGRQKAALCTRRAGKTFSCVRYLLYVALSRPKAHGVYINQSKDECRTTVWDNPKKGGLKQAITELGVPVSYMHDTRMEVRFHNGSRIRMVGVDDRVAMERLRGPDYDLAIVDESQKVVGLDNMLEDILIPATLDEAGTVVTIGTPGQVLEGAFWEITRDRDPRPGWSVHKWSLRANGHLTDRRTGKTGWQKAIEAKESNGWKDDNEKWQREFMGRWVAAASSLVYKLAQLDDDVRYYETLPAGHEWHYLVGIDIGWSSGSEWAYVVWGYCEEIPCLYEIDSFSESGLNTEQQASILQALVDEYDPEVMVADTGSGGLKQIVDGDYVGRFGLPVQHAQKRFKDAAITMFNTDAEAGRIKIRKGGALDTEMQVLPWKPRKPGVSAPRREWVEKFANHCCDSGLYSYRESYFYEAMKAEDDDPLADAEPGTAVWRARIRQAEAEEMASIRDHAISRPDESGSFYEEWG
jgi:hypothetical protein